MTSLLLVVLEELKINFTFDSFRSISNHFRRLSFLIFPRGNMFPDHPSCRISPRPL